MNNFHLLMVEEPGYGLIQIPTLGQRTSFLESGEPIFF
jgi:hypothetical protein